MTVEDRQPVGIQTVNLGKLMALVVIALAAMVGWMLGRIDDAGALGIIGPIIGYLVGNGVAAKRGDPVDPALGTRYNDRPS